MADTLPPANDEIVLIELFVEGKGIQRASINDNLDELKKTSLVAINLAMGTIRATAHRVGRMILEIERDLMPSEVEVAFAVKVEVGGSLETGQVTSLIAKADTNGSADGQFTVKFKWNVEKRQVAQVLVSHES